MSSNFPQSDGSPDATRIAGPVVFEVGRDESCGLLLTDPSASRHHARVTVGTTSVVVEDLGSSNGTWVDGVRITAPVEVQVGSQVAFASAHYAVVWSQDGLSATLTEATPTPLTMVGQGGATGYGAPGYGANGYGASQTPAAGASQQQWWRSTPVVVATVLGSVLVALVALLVLGAISGSGGKTGPFHDPETLATSVTSKVNGNLARDAYPDRVYETTCIEAQSGEYMCHLEMESGDRTSTSVTVAEDGQSWISHS